MLHSQNIALQGRYAPVTLPAGRHLTISGVNIEARKHVRYIGVEIDEHLTFKPQLASLHRKVGAKLSAVYRIRSHLTPKAKRTFYLSFILSTLEYASNAYVHTLYAAEFEALLKLSKRALRV